MALVRTPPGGSNAPFGGVGLKRSAVPDASANGKSQLFGDLPDDPSTPQAGWISYPFMMVGMGVPAGPADTLFGQACL